MDDVSTGIILVVTGLSLPTLSKDGWARSN
jgi:hypothetical protein